MQYYTPKDTSQLDSEEACVRALEEALDTMDAEEAHVNADAIVAKALRGLRLDKLADVFEHACKDGFWYS